jgi:hypothetical protein
MSASSHVGRALAFELQFEPGFFDAYKWLYSPSTREELEGLCKEARKQRRTPVFEGVRPMPGYVGKRIAGRKCDTSIVS